MSYPEREHALARRQMVYAELVEGARAITKKQKQQNTSMTDTNHIRIHYTDARLRVLVEEYITQQRGTFSLQGACAYVLYWAMEDGHTLPAAGALYQSDKLSPADCQRVSAVLQKIVREGRIAADGEQYRKSEN